MFKKLPILFGFLAAFLFFATQVLAASPAVKAVSDTVSSSPIPVTLKVAENGANPGLGVGTAPAEGDFVPDATVTFVGKTASRSGDFLDWTIRNYDWACVTRNADGACSNTNNPLVSFWALIRNIVYALLVLVVMTAAFVMIITRGRSLTITRFIPRFMFIIVLITLSYALLQFIFQVTDIVQGFFLRMNGNLISTHDLIFIGFDYKTFTGLRRYGIKYDESAFMTLLLVRLTAITYYVMTGVLLVRKIILWFFIILSPVFPLLLFFRPIRNTGKIWIGEFFRWLLYAPLFAIFLHGLVVLWRAGTPDKPGIPLAFDLTSTGHVPGVEGDVVYPTAVNILIGGPGQRIGMFNSVNLQDTFALYVVSLLMLWVVIILPFILLKIFLDYIGSISLQDNVMVKRILDKGASFMPTRTPPPAPAPVSPIPPVPSAGHAMQIPFAVSKTVSETRNITETRNVQSIASIPENARILQLANLSIPKMRDIAKYETSMLSKDTSRSHEALKLKSSLSRISNPSLVTIPSERERYTQARQQLVTEKQKGNPLATSILSAANTTSAQAKPHVMPGQKSTFTSTANMNLPTVNKVQQVSIEDYEEVKKMWLDTYQGTTPPPDLSGKVPSKEEWIKGDIDKINQAITLLNSVDPVRNKEGMDMVANILPFLMIGGFSRTEVVAYLKAKLEAAKSALQNPDKKDDEDTMVERSTSHTTAEKHLEAAAEEKAFGTEEDGEKKLEELKSSGAFGEENKGS
ncbi:MAG: hypothetical protein ACM3IJ_04175 [Candidatus Levyibacteriota bacterium]